MLIPVCLLLPWTFTWTISTHPLTHCGVHLQNHNLHHPPPPSPILPILGNPSLSCDAPLVEQVNCSFHRGELLFRLQPAFSDGVEECDNIHHHSREDFTSSPHCQAAAMRYCDYISSVMDTIYVEAIKRFRLTPPPPQCGIISSAVAWRGKEAHRDFNDLILLSYDLTFLAASF